MSLKHNTEKKEIMLVRDFQELAMEGEKRGYGRLRAFEEAWKYYLKLGNADRNTLRNYAAENGDLDFRKFLERAGRLHPALGMSDIVGIDVLLDSIGEEAERLGGNEEAEILKLAGLRARTEAERKSFKSSYFRRVGES
jgi:hypothetical protein